MDIWGEKVEIDCKGFEKLIPGFIAGKLDYPTLKSFSEHLEQCANCREEMENQLLVTEGMQRLEEGNAFDLQSELEQLLEEVRKKISIRSAFLYVGTAMEVVAVCMLVGIAVWILI